MSDQETGRDNRSTVVVHPIGPGESDWVERYTIEHWGSPVVAVHGMELIPTTLPGFVARIDGEPVGLITYRVLDETCEIVTLNSDREGRGVGSALVRAVAGAAREASCRKVWLITTNDNLRALRFYQRRHFELARIHRHAVDRARELKPEIPKLGQHGIPIRDEIELEWHLPEETTYVPDP